MECNRKLFLEFAKSKGPGGFTSYDAAKHFRVDWKRTSNLIVSCLGTFELKDSGRKFKDPKSRKWLKVYVSADQDLTSYVDKQKAKMVKNVMNEIINKGHDEDFQPVEATEICTAMPGSKERIATMARRAELGQDLWNDDVKDGFLKPGEIPHSDPDAYGSPREYRVVVGSRGAAMVSCG